MQANALFALALCTVGCSAGSSDPSGQSLQALQSLQGSVASCEFTTSTGIPSNPAPAVHVDVTDAATARSLYAATLALPAMPSGTYNCPADFGVTYHLAFLDASGASVVAAILDPDGCENVSVQAAGGSSVALWAATSAGYWSALATDLGVQESTIYPYTPPVFGDAGAD